MATVWIDGTSYEVDPSKHMLEVCLSLGYNLPFFCWHDALGSVGACRQCAVKQLKDEHDTKGKIVMACLTPAADGTRISIDDPEARAFRAGVIEFLMVNHPHDCPVCDEGGECHLQDMTVMTGHDYRTYRFLKRTHRNQDLGPFVNHEMNRCIACYRCVRFYQDYAGGRDLDVFGAHNHVYFGRREDGVLESELSGNLVEVCPTGVFTDKTLERHYTRKWDLTTAPSVCVHCSLGCNTIPGERYGELRRIRARYHSKVNKHFLCDRGRYGYEFVNHERRIREPLRPAGPGERARRTTAEEALRTLEPLLRTSRVIGIGSPRASLESSFALRQLVGPERFYQGVSAREARLVAAVLDVLQNGPARTPSLAEVERCDAVLVLGEDVSNTAPMLALALRQSVRRQPERAAAKLEMPLWHDRAVREVTQKERGPLYLATATATRLDGEARKVLRGPPEEVARLGFAVAHALDAKAPPVEGIRDETRALAEEIARALAEAERPLVVSGCGAGSRAVIRAAANVAWAAGKARGERAAEVFLAVPECNSLGLALLGGQSLDDAIAEAARGAVSAAIILEDDLYRHAPSAAVDRFFAKVRHTVILDHIATPTAARATLVLPAGTFAESDGVLVNNEGRAQRFYRVCEPRHTDVRESWSWLAEMGRRSGREWMRDWHRIDDVTAALAVASPMLAAASGAAAPSTERFAGSKLPRQPHRYSGRTAMHAGENVREAEPPADPDSPFAFTMEGFRGPEPGSLAPRFWAPGWNSVQALHRFQEEVGGPLRGGEPGVRLVEPPPAPRGYFGDVPGPFERHGEHLRLLPLYHVFGSEELSSLSPGVALLAPEPYIAFCPADAEALGHRAGEILEVDLGGGHVVRLAARILPELVPGTAGIPVGLAGMGFVPLPSWGKVAKP